MKDFNFFSIYSQKSAGKQLKLLLYAGLLLVLAFLVAGSWYLLDSHNRQIQDDVAEIDAYLASSTVRANYNRLSELRSDLNLLSSYEAALDIVNSNVELGHTFSSATLERISAVLPPESVIDNFSCTLGTLSMSIKLPDMLTAAKLIAGLDTLDFVSDAHLLSVVYTSSTVTAEDGSLLSEDSWYYAQVSASISAITDGGDAE